MIESMKKRGTLDFFGRFRSFDIFSKIEKDYYIQTTAWSEEGVLDKISIPSETGNFLTKCFKCYYKSRTFLFLSNFSNH